MSTKVVVNLATGTEDPERVMIAFPVGQAAAAKGKQVTMLLTKDAVHLAVPGHARGEACGSARRSRQRRSSATETSAPGHPKG